MHVKAKKIAFGGLLLALTMVCMAMGSILEFNTLFLLAAASYFVGIMIRETGIRTGAAFYLASVLLGFMISPNKLYVVSFSAMGLYILVVEQAFGKIGSMKKNVNKNILFWLLKYVVFNVLFIPVFIAFQKLLFARSLSFPWLVGIIAAGQAGLWIYDRAYEYFQSHVWGRLRSRFF